MASESRISQVATTIPVRNVQGLAACDAGELTAEALERYIRPDIDKDAVLYEHSGELPVVDLGRLLNPQSWEEEAAKLRSACEEWGFFQVLSPFQIIRCFRFSRILIHNFYYIFRRSGYLDV